MTSYDKELYITKDKFDLLERQFRKLVVKYDCKFSIDCNNVTGTSTTDKRGTTTYRDVIGRKQGTATTDNRGTTTYRDVIGRKDGTATTNGNTTTFRDKTGRKEGTSTKK